MRIRSTTNSKPLFFKGICLQDYVRNSSNIFMDKEVEQTIIIDQFNRPLINSENYQLLIQNKVIYAKKEPKWLETKASTTMGSDQEPFLPTFKPQNSAKIVMNSPIQLKSISKSFDKVQKKVHNYQMSPIELSKSRNMRKSILNNYQFIIKRKQSRQKCMASRQVSQQSEEQGVIVKKEFKRALSHRQSNEHIKKVLQLKRQESINRDRVIVIKTRKNDLESSLIKKEN